MATVIPGKIAVIGIGAVGSAVAFALMSRNVGRELVIIDIDKDRALGETLDLQDSMAFSSVKTVRSGDASDAKNAQIIGKIFFSRSSLLCN